jgi:hypothetical protein
MTVELEEFEPGRFRVRKDRYPAARSELPVPYVISDTMDPVEQVDGRFYSSKSAFRAVGKAHGLIEVGTSKLPPKTRTSDSPEHKKVRKNSIAKAIQEYKQGRRLMP